LFGRSHPAINGWAIFGKQSLHAETQRWHGEVQRCHEEAKRRHEEGQPCHEEASSDLNRFSGGANEPSDVTKESSGAVTEPSGATKESRRVTKEPSGATTKPSGVTKEVSGGTKEPSGTTKESSGGTAKPSGTTAGLSKRLKRPKNRVFCHFPVRGRPGRLGLTIDKAAVGWFTRTELLRVANRIGCTRMGTTYRFIEEPRDDSEVLAWFRALPTPPIEVSTAYGIALYFTDLGPLVNTADGKVDSHKSPVVSLFRPRVKRGILWTVGEVHFLATPLRQSFPRLYKVSSDFSRWLAAHECVYSNKRDNNDYDYYLEGSVRNFAPPVFALDSGLRALRAGRYFVSDHDNDLVLEKLSRALRLRGVECAEA